MIYLDTSIALALYLPEPHSDKAEEFVAKHKQPTVSDLVDVELRVVLARKVRDKYISPTDANRIIETYAEHRESGSYRSVSLRAKHFRLAADCAWSATTGLRTLDALHLAVVAEQGSVLVTSDRKLASAAQSLGLKAELISSR